MEAFKKEKDLGTNQLRSKKARKHVIGNKCLEKKKGLDEHTFEA